MLATYVLAPTHAIFWTREVAGRRRCREAQPSRRVKLAAHLRLEREGPQGDGRRHYGLAVGVAELVDDGEGDEEVRIVRR